MVEVVMPLLLFTRLAPDTGESRSANCCIRSPDMAEQAAGWRLAGTVMFLDVKLPKARHPELRSNARLILQLLQ